MHHKSTNEFHTGNGNHFLFFGFIILGMKRNFFFINGNDSGVSNGNAVGIPTEIFNRVSISVEGFFDFDIPVNGVKFVLEFVPGIMVSRELVVEMVAQIQIYENHIIIIIYNFSDDLEDLISAS